MQNPLKQLCMLVFMVAPLIGCADAPPAIAPVADSEYLLEAEPKGAADVKDARQKTDGDEVVVVGRIGGRENPWIEGEAAFMIVDRSLTPCNERPDDNCPVPWDYCCDTPDLPTHSVLVELIDADGKPVTIDARKLLGVKELQTVVVHGKLHKDDSGLSVRATGVFVRK